MSGALKRSPGRYQDRVDEPRPTTPIGEPPADFLLTTKVSKEKLRIWHELIKDAPTGVLTGCDRTLLANTCRIQAAIEGGDCTAAMFSQLRAHLGEMGMTPAGRSKVEGPKKDSGAKNPWQELAGEARRAN